MKAATVVLFEADERRVFELARLAVYIAWPNPEGQKSRRNQDADNHAVLNRVCTKNEVWHHKDLTRLLVTLSELQRVVDEQTRPEYWVSVGAPAPDMDAEPTSGAHVTAVIIESRFTMSVHIAEALDITRQALKIARPWDLDDDA